MKKCFELDYSQSKRRCLGEKKLSNRLNGDSLGCPPSQDASHHQDYYIFSKGSRTKPSFATGILGGGTTQEIHSDSACVVSLCFLFWLSWVGLFWFASFWGGGEPMIIY